MGHKRTRKSPKEKRVLKGINNSALLTQLLELANQLGVTVRQEKGDFKGGSCRVEEDKLLFLRKMDSDAVKIEVLATELIKLDFDDIEMDSTIRDFLSETRELLLKNNVAVEEEFYAKN